LAQMIRAERDLDLDLNVVQVEDWRRNMYFDETGLPWINPSPNMRNLTQALLYPGIGLLETTDLSVGRGTDTPFEIIGAPYINHLELAEELNRLGFEGVRFIPMQFTPNSSKFAHEQCQGVNIILTNREACPVIDLGIAIAHTLHRLYAPDFDIESFNRLLKYPEVLEQIKRGELYSSISKAFDSEEETFVTRRAPYLLYPN